MKTWRESFTPRCGCAKSVKRIRRDAEVTVSVSNHVPKPHTPFQFCAQDSLNDLQRKQILLRELARRERIEFKYHDKQMSWLEGLFSRGDRRLADVILAAHRLGARFDSWDEQFDIACGTKRSPRWGSIRRRTFMTMPILARLPMGSPRHRAGRGLSAQRISQGDEGSLVAAMRKAPRIALHHTNVEDALADERRLVCFDCGIACDPTQMRKDRLVALRKLGAETRTTAPMIERRSRQRTSRARSASQKAAFSQSEGQRYRLRYRKLGRAAFIGHLDAMRLLQRMLRRAGCEPIYTRGFHPKPDMVFGPALGLGVVSLGKWSICDSSDFPKPGNTSRPTSCSSDCNRQRPKALSSSKCSSWGRRQGGFAAYHGGGLCDWRAQRCRAHRRSTAFCRLSRGRRDRLSLSDQEKTAARWRASTCSSFAVSRTPGRSDFCVGA